MNRYDEIREAAFRGNLQLPQMGLVRFTFGNVSAADQTLGFFAIKPSGVPYAELKPSDMVVVDFEGKVVSGKLRPSSDTNTHAVLYQHLSGIGAVVHTHSTYATAWAQSLRDIPNYGTTHADHTVYDIPCAPPMKDEMIEGDYEWQTGFQILDLLKERNLSHTEIEMVLIGSHAPFTWGATVDKAVYNAAVLENLAEMAYLTEQINPQARRLKKALIEKHYQRKHGSSSYYGQ